MNVPSSQPEGLYSFSRGWRHRAKVGNLIKFSFLIKWHADNADWHDLHDLNSFDHFYDESSDRCGTMFK